MGSWGMSSSSPQHWHTRDGGFGPISQPGQLVTKTSRCCTWWHGVTGALGAKGCSVCPLRGHLCAAGTRGSCLSQPSVSRVLPFPPEHLAETAPGHGYGGSWLCSQAPQPRLSLCPLCHVRLQGKATNSGLSGFSPSREIAPRPAMVLVTPQLLLPVLGLSAASCTAQRLRQRGSPGKMSPFPRDSRAASDPTGPPGTVYLCTGDKAAVGHPISGLDSCSSPWPIPSHQGRSRDLPVLASPPKHQFVGGWLRILLRCPWEDRTRPHFRGTHRSSQPPRTCSMGPHHTRLQPPLLVLLRCTPGCWHPLRRAVPHLLHKGARREPGLKAGLGGMRQTW